MQGGPLSPLLSNIYLDDFDKELENAWLAVCAICGRFLIFTKTEVAAQRVFRTVETILWSHE